MKASKLPTPRMQLRWEVSTEPGHQWQCNYELVILLDKWDVRREVYKRGRELKRKLPRELVIPMKTPSFRNSSSHYPPCTSGDGKQRYADTPFRDGVHAKWDAIQLGDPPIFVIAPDGMAFSVEYDPAEVRRQQRA